MYQLLAFTVSGEGPLAPREADRRYLMALIHTLSSRKGVRLLAFRLEERRAGLLFEGEGAKILESSRLIRSGYRVWLYHRGAALRWGEPEVAVLPDEAAARAAADLLHGGADPLAVLWSSLRDGLGLRRAPWFDPSWLAEVGASALYSGACGAGAPVQRLELSGRPRVREPWGMIEAAVAAAAGADPRDREVRSICAVVGWRLGWSFRELCAVMEISEVSVRRTLLKADGEAAERALLHLSEPRLRSSLGTEGERWNRWGHPLEDRCPPQANSWSKLAQLSPGA